MRIKTLSAPLLVSIFCTVAAFSSAMASAHGKISDGGGSGDAPTRAEVKTALQQLADSYGIGEWSYVPVSFYTDSDGVEGLAPLAKPTRDFLEILIDDMAGSKGNRKGAIRIRFEEKNSCPSPEGDSEASAKICHKETPICFSLPLIEKHYPKVNLRSSLVPLFMHEVAHQNCADEPMAKQIERFYGKDVLVNANETFEVQWQSRLVAIYLEDLRGDQAAQEEGELCWTLGKLDSGIESFTRAVAIAVRRDGHEEISKLQRDANIRLINTQTVFDSYCQRREDSLARMGLKIGDRSALRPALDEAAAAVNDIALELKARTGIKVWVPQRMGK